MVVPLTRIIAAAFQNTSRQNRVALAISVAMVIGICAIGILSIWLEFDWGPTGLDHLW